MQKNKINFSKKVVGFGLISTMILCQNPVYAQMPKSITFKVMKPSKPMPKKEVENALPDMVAASSATITNSNGTKTTLHIPAEVIPDLFSQMTAAQKYCDDLMRAGVPKEEAIKQMQIAIFSGEFDGNKTGNAAPTDGCNIV